MADDGIDGEALTLTKTSSTKKKSLPKPKASKRSTRASPAASTEEQPDELADPEGSGMSGDKSKRQKELPKPAIIINMHHPWGFKNQQYLRKRARVAEDERTSQYRPLKHIIGSERAEWKDAPSHPAYWTIKAPPRLKPPKKYSDISGFEAKYTDPETKLHYCDAEEFEIVRSLTRDLVQSYLRLRGYVDIIG
ncbi:hypothetical protein RvY_09999 [Ramazzottius varieornatus]|uniref:Vps72/YL1 C-terminal domain-containing protein n=1 Tax=Ramazzottius varieornatus TaxID=947166 RepID=A0A1D1VDQ5_RAMVA|nr:hypothetical protein RvY_09999 [Ramazzottius varieornatus]